MIKDPTLAETFQFIGETDSDIADTIFDFYSNICYSEKSTEDYDKCMSLFCELIMVEQVVPARHGNVSYIICRITDFVEKYKEVFRDSMNECYREGCRPCDWGEDYTPDDEDFYDTYLNFFEIVITGNLPESAYGEIYNKLLELKQRKD